MAQPLPGTWVDCNIATSYYATGSLGILAVPAGAPSGIQGLIGDWDLIDNSIGSGAGCPNPGEAAGTREVMAQNSNLAIGPTSVWSEAFT